MRQGRFRLGDESGQALILFVLAMPLVLLVIATLVIDGTNLFVHKRSSQNAADAVALAVAHDLDPYGMPSSCAAGTACATDAGYYGRNNDAVDPAAKTQLYADHVCTSSSDLNCVFIQMCGTAPCYIDKNGTPHYDKVRITVRRSLASSFGKTVGYSNFKVSATAVAHVTPCGAGTTNCHPLFAYAMSTASDAIQIHGPNGSTASGNDRFPGLWSNGGIVATSPGNQATTLLLDSAFQGTYSVPSSGNLCVGDGCPGFSASPTYVPQRTVPYWPSPLPSYSCLTDSGSFSVNASWFAANTTPGVYCATKTSNSAIDITGSGLDLTGYTFVANKNVTVTGTANNDTFGCPSTTPCSAPNTVFYSINGDVGFNGCTNADGTSNCPFVGVAEMYAPNGGITFPGSSTGVFNGVMEAQTITINAKNTTFVGSGALVGGLAQVFLDE